MTGKDASAYLRYRKSGKIAYLTFFRPTAMNAITPPMIADMNMNILLTGRQISAQESLAFGLISKVVPTDQVMVARLSTNPG